MKTKLILIFIAVIAWPLVSTAVTPSDNFRNGIVGSGFVSNGGSSTSEYKILIDYRVHGRHRVELKFVERTNYDEQPLAASEDTETLMVNCTGHTYTSSIWLKKNDHNIGQKIYKNGSEVSWNDQSERAYANYGNGWMLPLYLKMVCDSL